MNSDFLATLNLLPAEEQIAQQTLASVETQINCACAEEARERLSVYRNNVLSSLSQALAEIFPVCQQLVGEEFFNALSREFIRGYLPTSPVLSDYGAEFSEFIADFPPVAQLPYLSAVAELEYELLGQTLKAEEPVLSPTDIQQQLATLDTPEESYWSLAGNIRLYHCRYAVGSLYLAHQPDSPLTLSEINWQESEYILLAKQGLWGQCYRLDAATFQLLQRLQGGASLAAACEDIEPQQLNDTLSQIIRLPVIRSINTLADTTGGK